jgi:hypothetical protein
MKNKIIAFLILLFVANICFGAHVTKWKMLEANNIRSNFYNEGYFDHGIAPYAPGFEWPKGSGKYAMFTAGINLTAFINGQLRQAASCYNGEFVNGSYNNNVINNSPAFKIYKVSRGDNYLNNPDWAEWGSMIPYGATYIDTNHNGIYDPAIDIPGIPGAASTIFMCLTDADSSTHQHSEPFFNGGTPPLYSEIHITVWAYSDDVFSDMQFMKYEIINKGVFPWNRTHFTIIADTDLGSDDDDYVGCDTVRKLGYCYNATNYDSIYGANPPAVGFVFLKGMTDKFINNNPDLGMTSFCPINNYSNQNAPCEFMGYSYHSYLFMMGRKVDSSSWLDVTQPFNGNHYKSTKFCYYGDPESSLGWTELKGKIKNCDFGLNDTGTVIAPNLPGDRVIVMSSGSENLTVNPGDTQTVYLSQLITRGSNNLNSVTMLKKLADRAQYYYNMNFGITINNIITKNIPEYYSLSQNYPNPFNPKTNIRFTIPANQTEFTKNVKLSIFDINGKTIAVPVNKILPSGVYEVVFDGTGLSSGIYFYALQAQNVLLTRKMILLK